MSIVDKNARTINYARISVTDRCNFRCRYCMPTEGVSTISHEHILRYEDIIFLASVLQELGVKKIRFTGGEPLVRKDFLPFLRHFKDLFPDIAVFFTTNASLLASYVDELSTIPITGVNISLDTLDPVRFVEITRNGDVEEVKRGIEAAAACGIPSVKTNTVIMKGFNDSELIDIMRFSWSAGALPRFIEFMPLSGEIWSERDFLGAHDVLQLIANNGGYASAEEEDVLPDVPSGPAKYYMFKPEGKRFGIIEAVSNHFCASCNRLRITSEGMLRACLFSREEVSLVGSIRARDRNELKMTILSGMKGKPDYWEDLHDGKQSMYKIGG